jgi:hypothetical protein
MYLSEHRLVLEALARVSAVWQRAGWPLQNLFIFFIEIGPRPKKEKEIDAKNAPLGSQ